MADVGAREVLELERDVLGDVARPRALPEPRDEAAAPAERAGVVLERGQHLDQRLDEARDPVARELLEHAEVDDLADDRLARPVVGAAQDAGLEDAQRRLGAWGPRRIRAAAASRLRRGAAVAVRRLRLPRPGCGSRLRHVASSGVGPRVYEIAQRSESMLAGARGVTRSACRRQSDAPILGSWMNESSIGDGATRASAPSTR